MENSAIFLNVINFGFQYERMTVCICIIAVLSSMKYRLSNIMKITKG